MGQREFPLPASQAEDLETLRRDLNDLIAFLEKNFRIEAENAVDSYETGWSDGTDEVEFRKDPNNRVFIRGFAAKTTPSPPEKIFTLPAGYRPGVDILYWSGEHELEVKTDGSVYYNSTVGAWGGSTNLTGINFFAEG